MDGDGYRELEIVIEGADQLEHCYLAVDGAARRRGLAGSDSLPEGTGLLIPGAPIIHMIGMRYPLDLVFISPCRKIVKIKLAVDPGLGLHGSMRSWYCLEMNAGAAARLGIRRGQQASW